MQKTALVGLAAFLLLASPVFASTADIKNDVNVSARGGNSDVKVNINNQANTGGSSGSTSESKTEVKINQTGEGTSEVKINGKEYKVEGPGSLNISTSSSSPASSSSTTPSTEVKEEVEGRFAEIIKMLEELLNFFKNFRF